MKSSNVEPSKIIKTFNSTQFATILAVSMLIWMVPVLGGRNNQFGWTCQLELSLAIYAHQNGYGCMNVHQNSHHNLHKSAHKSVL